MLGVAGVGKSRLVRELVGELAGQALVARGRCLPYGEGITFWPLLEAVKGAVELEDGDSPEESCAKLARALEGEQGGELAAQQVAELIGIAEGGGGAEDGFTAVRMLFETLAGGHPLLLVFDDIHWGEATFLDLLEHIADWARGAPILLICLARPELLDVRPGWGGGKLNATSVLLEPLSDDECGRLIENLVGQVELAEEVGKRIAEASEGNPLFVEEMLSMLIDDGLLVRENGRWAATRDLAAVPVPPTIHALLAARLDRLGADERAVIDRAAVEGKVFHEGAVTQLAPEALRPSVGTHLAALVRKELIRPDKPEHMGERAFRFRHLLIRDAAYDSIPKTARAELHELFGRWLEERTSERTPGYEEIIGYHLEQTFLYRAELGPVDDATRPLAREAAERLGAAGHRAFTRGDAAAAVNLISRAVALLPADDPSRVGLIPNARVVQGLSGDLSWADRVLTEAVAAAAATDDRGLEAHALVQRGFLRLFTQPDVAPEELFEVAEHAIAVFEEFGDELGLARAWRLVAQAHYLAREGGPSAEASSRALEHARLAGDRLELREIVEWLCVALMLGPTPAPEAAARCEGLLADVGRDPILEPTVLSVLANIQAMQGRVEQANELLVRWRHAVDELGRVDLALRDQLRILQPGRRSRRRRARASARVRGPQEDRGEEPFLLGRGLAFTCDVRAGTVRRGRAAQPGKRGGSTTERHPLPHSLAHHARAGVRAQRRARVGRDACPRSGRVRGGKRLSRLARRRAREPRRGPPSGCSPAGSRRRSGRGRATVRAEGQRRLGRAGRLPARGDRPKADVVDTPPRARPAMALPRSCHTIAAARALAVASASTRHRLGVDHDAVVALGELDRREAVEHVGEHARRVALERVAVAARVRHGDLDRVDPAVQRLAGELRRPGLARPVGPGVTFTERERARRGRRRCPTAGRTRSGRPRR